MENELLLFEIRSIADQAEQGFMKAAKSAQELGTAYEDLMKKRIKRKISLPVYLKRQKNILLRWPEPSLKRLKLSCKRQRQESEI